MTDEFAKLDAAIEDFIGGDGKNEYNLVDAHNACPQCGERHVDNLVWIDSETVHCQTCGRMYELK